MKLFEVTRWGNAVDGGNGPDTNYLVCAGDHQEAAALVREREPVFDVLDVIAELGVCTAEVENPVVFRGPYIEHKLGYGTNFTLWSWNLHELEVWVPMALRREGEAVCHCADGRLAARRGWRDGREHGTSELWYSNGQLMQRAEHRDGTPTGVHESWYADGAPASRYEYYDNGVRYKRWDRYCRLIEEGNEDRGRRDVEPGEAPDSANG